MGIGGYSVKLVRSSGSNFVNRLSAANKPTDSVKKPSFMMSGDDELEEGKEYQSNGIHDDSYVNSKQSLASKRPSGKANPPPLPPPPPSFDYPTQKTSSSSLLNLNVVEKVAGTSLMLCDDCGHIFKLIDEGSDSELSFYQEVEECFNEVKKIASVLSSSAALTSSVCANLGQEEEAASSSRMPSYPVKEEEFSKARSREDLAVVCSKFVLSMAYLSVNSLIPEYLGVAHVAHTDEGKWTLVQHPAKNENMLRMLKMRNFLFDMKSPAILDLKLGSCFIGMNSYEAGFDQRRMFEFVSDSKKFAYTERWRKMKRWIRASYSPPVAIQKIREISPEDLEFEEAKNVLSPEKLSKLLRSWRQEQMVGMSTQKTLGFRVCGVEFNEMSEALGKSRPVRVSQREGVKLQVSSTVNLIRRFLGGCKHTAHLMLLKLFKIRHWLAVQPYIHFYATSVVLAYDEANISNVKIQWLDFAHAYRRKDVIKQEKQRPFPYTDYLAPSNRVYVHPSTQCEDALIKRSLQCLSSSSESDINRSIADGLDRICCIISSFISETSSLPPSISAKAEQLSLRQYSWEKSSSQEE